jgi:hypothetical protein
MKIRLLAKEKKQKHSQFLWTNADLLGYKINHKIKNTTIMLNRTTKINKMIRLSLSHDGVRLKLISKWAEVCSVRN